MKDSRFVNSWLHSWMVTFAQVESLLVPVLWGRGRLPPSGITSEAERQVEMLFQSLLSEAFKN